jgi:hypothetical protein
MGIDLTCSLLKSQSDIRGRRLDAGEISKVGQISCVAEAMARRAGD